MRTLRRLATFVTITVFTMMLDAPVVPVANAYCLAGENPFVEHDFQSQWILGWNHFFFPSSASEADVLWAYPANDETVASFRDDSQIQEKLMILAQGEELGSKTSVLLDSSAVEGGVLELYDRVVKGGNHVQWRFYFASPDKELAGHRPQFGIINWKKTPEWPQIVEEYAMAANRLDTILCGALS